MSETRRYLADWISEVYRSRPKEGVREWAIEKIRLKPGESQDFAGKYDPEITPCTDLLMDFATDPEWEECVIMKSSQSGITLTVLIIVAYYIAHFAYNILYALDSAKEMQRVGRTRLVPLLEDCPDTAGQMAEAGEGITGLTLFLRGLTVYLTGAHSSGQLANKSTGLVIGDELDKHPPSPQGEANTADLLRARAKAVSGGKLILFSSPRGPNDLTNQEYLTGSRHRCFVPCPHCKVKQTLDHEQLDYSHCRLPNGRYDLHRVHNEAGMKCKHCSRLIEEKHKAWMLAPGNREWRPTNLGQDEHQPEPGKMSIHISDFYSFFPKVSWGRIARKAIKAEKSLSAKKDLFNNNYGLPMVESGLTLDALSIRRMCGAYQHGHCPVRPSLIIMAADVQGDRKKWVIVAFARDGTAWVINYGSTLSYDELLEVANRPIIIDDWGDTPEAERINPVCTFGLIDEGHDTKGVRDFCQRSYGRFSPVKGVGIGTVRDVVEEKRHFRHEGVPIFIYHISDEDWKNELYRGRIGQHDKILAGTSSLSRLWFPMSLEEEFIAELIVERREQVMIRGRLVWRWDPEVSGNDWGDALKYTMAGYYQAMKSLGGDEAEPRQPEEPEPAPNPPVALTA